MSVAFNTIPGNVLVPFFYAEVNSGGTPYQGQSRLLLIGQKTSAGTATAAVPIGPISSEQQVIGLTGLGSMLVEMYRIARQNAPFQPIWLLPIADPAGVAATGTITITAPAVTGVGVLSVAGQRLTIQVNAADNATTVAAAIVAAITTAGLPVTASNSSGVVTVTARHVGAISNGLELRVKADEPNVLTTTNAVIVAIGAGTAGTGTPTLTSALANLGDDEFDWIAAPYADTTSLNAIRDFLSDTSGRWSYAKQLYGHYTTAFIGNLSTVVAMTNARNDRHVNVIGSQALPTPVWALAAAAAAIEAVHLTDAPECSRPLQTLELSGVQPPVDRSTWWSQSDRQALYVDGCGAFKVTIDGRAIADRFVTTEQVNTAGVTDRTFMDVETLGQMMFIIRFFRTEVANRHSRQALADDNPGNLAEITTPNDVKATLIHAYRRLCFEFGVCEKPDLFAGFVVVERDPNDANRLNCFLPIDVINQLRVFASNVTTFLQYVQ